MTSAIDFETALIEPGLQAPPPVCMSVASKSGGHPGVLFQGAYVIKEEALDHLEELLIHDEKLVGCNTAFDMIVACAERPSLMPLIFEAYDDNRITDIAIRQKLIDIAMGEYRQHGGYSLAELVKRLCDREMAKADTYRMRYWELIDTPLEDWPQEAIEYSALDAIGTLDVYAVQTADLLDVDKMAVLTDEYRQSRADFALKLASAWGLRTDREGVEQLREVCVARQDELREELLAAGLLKWTKKKGEMVISKCVRIAQKTMLETVGWDGVILTKKGEGLKKAHEPYQDVKYISCGAEACSDSGDPILEKYAEFSQLGTMMSGPMKTIESGVNHPIHTYFEVLLDSGRTSSSKPPLQNLARKPGVRESFKPRPGYVYVGCDIDRAELHTLSQVCINIFKRSNLADTLNAGIDPHTKFGARLAHTTYEDLNARLDTDESASEWRRRAKPANFGFPGGMGAKGMRRYAKSTYGVVISEEESVHLHEQWQEEYPEVAIDYLGWIRNLCGVKGYTTIEHFDSHRWRGHCTYCVAANSFFQGMAADALKLALWEVTKKCYTPGTALYGSRVVNEVHDEILIETPLPVAHASEAAWEMQRTMVDAYNQYTRDVPVSASPVMMDRWSKKAKTIIEAGELQLWRYEG